MADSREWGQIVRRLLGLGVSFLNSTTLAVNQTPGPSGQRGPAEDEFVAAVASSARGEV